MKGRCQRYQRVDLKCSRAFSFFGPKIFLSISRFLGVALLKGKCNRYQRVDVHTVCDYFRYTVQKYFLQYLDFWLHR